MWSHTFPLVSRPASDLDSRTSGMRAQSFYSLFLTSFFFVDLLASSVDDQPEHAWWKRGGHGRVRGCKNRKTRLVDQFSVERAKKKGSEA